MSPCEKYDPIVPRSLTRVRCIEMRTSDNIQSTDHSFSQTPMNYGDMKKQNWSISGQHQINNNNAYTSNNNDDDDDDVQLGNNTFYKRNAKTEEVYKDDDDDEQTVKAAQTQKTPKETMIERRLHAADERAQVLACVFSK